MIQVAQQAHSSKHERAGQTSVNLGLLAQPGFAECSSEPVTYRLDLKTPRSPQISKFYGRRTEPVFSN
jgi:hypothetical protein